MPKIELLILYNYKNGQYTACVTILYISKLIAKIRGGALYVKVNLTALISILVVCATILIMPIYQKPNS